MDHSAHGSMDMDMSSNSTMSDGMGMGAGAGGRPCKISMLLNYNTVDSCFISSDWQITSRGMFAGSCIGVLLLCIAIEAVRRLGREYDRRLVLAAKARIQAQETAEPESLTAQNSESKLNGSTDGADLDSRPPLQLTTPLYQPSIIQHLLRSLVYGSTFTAAFFVMLLGMYYNVYILICIFLGHTLGYILFARDTLGHDGEATGATGRCC